MKPTLQTENLNQCGSRTFPKTDYNYHSAGVGDFDSRCAGKTSLSFRAISAEYFKSEARQDFVSEAVFFSLIILTAAIPIISSVNALADFVRAIGAV
jgi:hypothetical protein